MAEEVVTFEAYVAWKDSFAQNVAMAAMPRIRPWVASRSKGFFIMRLHEIVGLRSAQIALTCSWESFFWKRDGTNKYFQKYDIESFCPL